MKTTVKCPRCGFGSESGFADCPKCGVIVGKYMEMKHSDKKIEDREFAARESSLQNLAAANALVIRQRKEWGEIVSGFETKNTYDVMDHWKNPLFEAEEEGGSFGTIITRFLLTAMRPFTMHIFSIDGKGLLKLNRPFRFYFHELEVSKANGAVVGTIKRRFSILRRHYSVRDRHGNEVYQLFGPILHPWTFQIKKNGQELGKITKKWGGLLKESMTDADNFGINFPPGINLGQKALLLGAVFLIDFVHFESRGGRN
jgi:uncharacterized protein YxjI